MNRSARVIEQPCTACYTCSGSQHADCPIMLIWTLRCCHISSDSVNGRRTDRKSTKNVYPVVKVVSVAMKVVAECVRSA